MEQRHPSTRATAAVIVASLVSTCFAIVLLSAEKTYSAKSDDEIRVLSLVLKSEVVANNWTKKDLICFSVDQSYPSSKLVRSLRQQNLNVCSSADWPRKFNCGFEVRINFSSFDASQNARVHAVVADLREINAGQGDLAVQLRDGEYSIGKKNGKWSVSDYASSK
jgi:hypothetical protein